MTLPRIPLRDMPGNGESLGEVIDAERARITRRCNDPKLSGTPYRAELHEELNFAARCRKSGNLDLARRALTRLHGRQYNAEYWQPIP